MPGSSPRMTGDRLDIKSIEPIAVSLPMLKPVISLLSSPGLTRQSMMNCNTKNQYCLRTWRLIMDARVKPAHDGR